MLKLAESVEEEILRACDNLITQNKTHASCLIGPSSYGPADDETPIDVLLVVPSYQSGIRNLVESLDSTSVSIVVADQEVFEKDIEYAKYGEFLADMLAFPYIALHNRSYLERMEVTLKKRIILNLLRNIISQYPELSNELLIKPQYFMHELARRRVRIFPPARNSFLSIFIGDSKEENISSIMEGYQKALKQLESENCVTFVNDLVKLNRNFIEKEQHQKKGNLSVLTPVYNALRPHMLGLSSKITTTFLRNRGLLESYRNDSEAEDIFLQLSEPESFLLMPTRLGPVPLSNKTSVEDFVRKTVQDSKILSVDIKEMGGVLNSVFMLRLRRKSGTQKIVVKKFQDWLGFKWFPLALWAIGTQSFAVLGKTRLEKEYSINQFLRKRGFKVPKIVHISLRDRLIFEEFVEGEKLSKIIKRIVASKSDFSFEGEIIRAVGKEVARAHSHGVALGDCKPENIMITDESEVCFLDLEQATRNGNQPWDIAEFLYYSGHYVLPTHSDKAAEAIAVSFVEGYLHGGGSLENVSKAASARYTKVFSIFTLPHIILMISRVCKNAHKMNVI